MPVRRTRRRRHQRSQGQMMVAFALMFGFFIFGLIVAVIDLASLYAQQSQLAKAAQDGAVAGAADVDIPTFRATGKVHILATAKFGPGPVAAGPSPCVTAIANDLAGFTGVTATCAYAPAGDHEMVVTVQRTVTLPIPLGISTAIVRTNYSALAQCGTVSATGNVCN